MLFRWGTGSLPNKLVVVRNQNPIKVLYAVCQPVQRKHWQSSQQERPGILKIFLMEVTENRDGLTLGIAKREYNSFTKVSAKSIQTEHPFPYFSLMYLRWSLDKKWAPKDACNFAVNIQFMFCRVKFDTRELIAPSQSSNRWLRLCPDKMIGYHALYLDLFLLDSVARPLLVKPSKNELEKWVLWHNHQQFKIYRDL